MCIASHCALLLTHAGIGAQSEELLTFNSSMPEENFYQWLRSRGISEKDCKVLSGKYNYTSMLNTYYCYDNIISSIENGVTPSGFIQLDAEDFDDIGLTKIGKKLVLKILAEVSSVPS